MRNDMPLSYRGAAIALAGSLVVAFVLCAIVQLIIPGAQFSHAWLTLFTNAPIGTFKAWAEGIISSVVVGAVLGYVFAYLYNWATEHSS